MKLISFFICWLSYNLVIANDNNNLIVYLHSGTKITLPVNEKPQITFEGNVLCINTERYQFTDVKKYTFSENEDTSIEVVEADGTKGLMKLDGEKIAISSNGMSKTIQIYSSKGIEQKVSQQTGNNGTIVVDLSGLGADVYIINAGEQGFKIRKR